MNVRFVKPPFDQRLRLRAEGDDDGTGGGGGGGDGERPEYVPEKFWNPEMEILASFNGDTED